MSNGRSSDQQDGGTLSAPVAAEQLSAAELSARVAHRLLVLGEMTAGIAHDFRNILAVIDSGLRLAEKRADDPTAESAFISGAREGVARGLALTLQLLAFAKQQECEPRVVDANELLKGLERFLRYSVGSEIRVALHLSTEISHCLIDPSQFNAAILNLVLNARDAMPQGGEIQLSTAPWVVRTGVSGAAPGNYVRVTVRDDGIGMPNQVLENIFQPFFTTKGELGTGLGVPQVGAFMHHIGGHVRVASEIGRGTTFDLFFPAAASAAAHPRIITTDRPFTPQLSGGHSRMLPSIKESRTL